MTQLCPSNCRIEMKERAVWFRILMTPKPGVVERGHWVSIKASHFVELHYGLSQRSRGSHSKEQRKRGERPFETQRKDVLFEPGDRNAEGRGTYFSIRDRTMLVDKISKYILRFNGRNNGLGPTLSGAGAKFGFPFPFCGGTFLNAHSKHFCEKR